MKKTRGAITIGRAGLDIYGSRIGASMRHAWVAPAQQSVGVIKDIIEYIKHLSVNWWSSS